jgi:hypothetical protein
MVEYNIEDFTIEHYTEILNQLLIQKRQFLSFDMVQDNIKNSVLLRHDIDLQVDASYEIASLENSLGIKSNYFILLHSPFYNFFENQNFKMLNEIIKMGHYIGLHFDSTFYKIENEEQLTFYLEKEKNIFKSIFECNLSSFSFHLTNSFTNNCENIEYAKLVNAYASYIKNNFKYCSDSYGLWRFSRMIDFIKENKESNIQLLTHPEWWVHNAMMPIERIKKIIETGNKNLWKEVDLYYNYKG